MEANPQPNPDPKEEDVTPITPDVLAPAAEDDAALPVPQGPLRTLDGPEKQSFWKRLAPRNRTRRVLALQGEDIHQICERLTIVESRIGAMQEQFNDRLLALEHRLDEVWEAEEQLSHLVDMQAKLDELLAQQKKLSAAGPQASSNMALWALVAVLGLALAAALTGVVSLG